MDWQQLDRKCWGTWHARNEAEATLLHMTQCAVKLDECISLPLIVVADGCAIPEWLMGHSSRPVGGIMRH